MCIRDRLEGDDEGALEGGCRVGSELGRQVCRVHTTDDEGAVSYTHLRAHETVLDLVCRLLLEKKKNTEQDSTRHTQKPMTTFATLIKELVDQIESTSHPKLYTHT